MKAQNIVLTHFSSRYPLMPTSIMSPHQNNNNNGKGFSQTVTLALDHARMRIGDLWKMQLYFPAISQSLQDNSEEYDEEEELMLLNADEG